TKAFDMKPKVPAATSRRRTRKLIELLQGHAFENRKALVGTRVEVLLEGTSDETDLLLQGRMPTQAQEIDGHVLINDLGEFESEKFQPGDLIEVEITEAMPQDLMARVTKIKSKF